MDTEREEMLYQHTLKMVLWDEDKDRIFTRMQANGIRGRAADALYQRARSERIAMIRRDCWKGAFAGAVLVPAGIGLFCVFWYGIGILPDSILIASALICVYGCWKVIKGLVGVITAAGRQGSLADED